MGQKRPHLCYVSVSWGFPKVFFFSHSWVEESCRNGRVAHSWRMASDFPSEEREGIGKYIPHFPIWNKCSYELWSGKGDHFHARADAARVGGGAEVRSGRNNDTILSFSHAEWNDEAEKSENQMLLICHVSNFPRLSDVRHLPTEHFYEQSGPSLVT